MGININTFVYMLMTLQVCGVIGTLSFETWGLTALAKLNAPLHGWTNCVKPKYSALAQFGNSRLNKDLVGRSFLCLLYFQVELVSDQPEAEAVTEGEVEWRNVRFYDKYQINKQTNKQTSGCHIRRGWAKGYNPTHWNIYLIHNSPSYMYTKSLILNFHLSWP